MEERRSQQQGQRREARYRQISEARRQRDLLTQWFHVVDLEDQQQGEGGREEEVEARERSAASAGLGPSDRTPKKRPSGLNRNRNYQPPAEETMSINGVALVREKVEEEEDRQVLPEEEGYVYDVYVCCSSGGEEDEEEGQGGRQSCPVVQARAGMLAFQQGACIQPPPPPPLLQILDDGLWEVLESQGAQDPDLLLDRDSGDSNDEGYFLNDYPEEEEEEGASW